MNPDHHTRGSFKCVFVLPDDVLRVIYSYLPYFDLANVAGTSKTNDTTLVARENEFWKHLLLMYIEMNQEELERIIKSCDHTCYEQFFTLIREGPLKILNYTPINAKHTYIGSNFFLKSFKLKPIIVPKIQGKKKLDPTDRIKLVIVGDDRCGKTSLLFTLKCKEFPQWLIMPVFENCDMTIPYGPDKNCILKLFDTCSREEYVKLRLLSYCETNVFLICISVLNSGDPKKSLLNWSTEIRRECPRVAIILIGTKCDLRNDPDTLERVRSKGERVITYEEGVDLSKSFGFVTYFETSAKDGKFVEDLKKLILMVGGFDGFEGKKRSSNQFHDSKKCLVQ